MLIQRPSNQDGLCYLKVKKDHDLYISNNG